MTLVVSRHVTIFLSIRIAVSGRKVRNESCCVCASQKNTHKARSPKKARKRIRTATYTKSIEVFVQKANFETKASLTTKKNFNMSVISKNGKSTIIIGNGQMEIENGENGTNGSYSNIRGISILRDPQINKVHVCTCTSAKVWINEKGKTQKVSRNGWTGQKPIFREKKWRCFWNDKSFAFVGIDRKRRSASESDNCWESMDYFRPACTPRSSRASSPCRTSTGLCAPIVENETVDCPNGKFAGLHLCILGCKWRSQHKSIFIHNRVWQQG